MLSSRKRPQTSTREEPEATENEAFCPFTVIQATAWSKPAKSKQKQKRRRVDGEGGDSDGDGGRQLFQISPFSPAMPLDTHPKMDMHYTISPYKQWTEMTPYNSFILNGTKYFRKMFVYVANGNTIQRLKKLDGSALNPNKKSDNDWVARILEIRAKDEHHVYARVHWMYWPDEIIDGTLYRKNPIKGRQPFHGSNELIASNHSTYLQISTTQIVNLGFRRVA
jgi:hypothetical protein